MDKMEKTERFVQLKKLAVSVISYWSILSVPVEEKLNFMPLLHYAKADSVDEIPEHIAVSEDFMKTVESECDRLKKLVADLILRKNSKLDQIYQRTHLELLSAGQGSSDVSMAMAFELVNEQISTAKAISMKRQDIVTRVELLQRARDEIEWYLKPASSTEDPERFARGKVLVDCFAKMMEDLEDNLTVWNLKEDKKTFLFDGADVRQKIKAMENFYNDHIKTDMNIDIDQLVVPWRPRTARIPVNVNVPPLLQPQVPLPPPPQQPQVPPLPQPSPQLSDGDDSMVSSESKSDSKDSDYRPSGSDASE